MPPKQIIFIHHDQINGRISHHGATKAWTHVSRRSWQEKPNHLTFKMWTTPANPPEQEVNMILGNGNRHKINPVPHDRFQQAYNSKTCFQPIQPPDYFFLLESTFTTILDNNRRRPKNTPSPSEDVLQWIWNMNDFSFSVRCGIDMLAEQQFSQAFACFEFALRCLRRGLNAVHAGLNDVVLACILDALGYAQSRNAAEVVQSFLRQTAALAAIIGGLAEPIAICSRNLLTMGTTPILFTELFVANIRTCGAYSEHGVMVDGLRLKCEYLGAGCPLEEVEQAYDEIKRRFPQGVQSWRKDQAFNDVSMAQSYLDHHRFVEAASVLRHVYGDLQEYEDNEWMWDSQYILHPSRVCMTAIILQLQVLGQALAGQGKHESAEYAFKTAISAATRHLQQDEPCNPSLLTALRTYSRYLSSRRRVEDTRKIRQRIDAMMAEFMLRE